MKKRILNLIAALAIVAGLAFSTIAPGWVVWLILAPVIYLAVLYLLAANTNYITRV